MSEKRVVVPPAMLEVAWSQCGTIEHYKVREALEAALLWLSENPQMPEIKQLETLWNSLPESTGPYPYWQKMREVFWQWSVRMFLAPEPEVPEEVKDLLLVTGTYRENIPNEHIIEAFNRGRKAGK